MSVIAEALGFATILAQQSAKPANQPSAWPMLIGLGFFFAIFYFVLMRGNRKQQKDRQNLINNLAKNDKVLTIGGIIGTVAQVKDHEVTIKVDESSNTKMTFLKTAIQKVITDSDPASPESK